jgi:hypothetical protein
MLVVQELYKEAILKTERKLIFFNGELDQMRSGCILLYRAHASIDYLYWGARNSSSAIPRFDN